MAQAITSRATLPRYPGQGGGYATVESSGCGGVIFDVKTSKESTRAISDPAFDYPFGLVEFRLPCAAAEVSVVFHEAARRWTPYYRKYGPLVPGERLLNPWYSLPSEPPAGYGEFSSRIIGGRTVAVWTLFLEDGAFGDDSDIDGQIIDAGGIAVNATLPLYGKTLRLRDNLNVTKRSIAFQGKDTTIFSAIPGTTGDPTCSGADGGGATLEVFGTAGSGHGTGLIELPCANWKVIGRPEDGKGYKYTDRGQDDSPCKKAQIKTGKVVKVSCSGKNPSSPISYDLTAAGEGSVGIVLATGASSIPYCAEFTGVTSTVQVDDENQFNAKNALWPPVCPSP